MTCLVTDLNSAAEQLLLAWSPFACYPLGGVSNFLAQQNTMQTLRQPLMDARTSLTMPLRARRLRKLASAGVAPMSVIFYHRVADVFPNTWTISCNAFEHQIEYCREHATIFSLDELQRRSRLGYNAEPTVSFTFDDGYAENCRFAIPYLIRH